MRRLHTLGNIPLFSEVILIAALAWMVSGWLLPADAPTPSSQPLNMADATQTLPNLASLVSVPLFGNLKTVVQPTRTVVHTPKPITLSPLNIKLLGTVVAEDHAAAIIAMAAGREQRVFFIGDSIQPGVVLKTVETEAIVVERGGKLERISLEQSAKLSAMPTPSNSIVSKSARPVARSMRRPGIPSQSTPPQSTRRQMNRNHLQKQLQDFPALLSQARVLPHMNNGKPEGFTISEIAPGSLYQQAGLLNGDIILSVNGKRISDARQAMGMYQSLQSAAAIDLELLRAGQLRQIHYDIR